MAIPILNLRDKTQQRTIISALVIFIVITDQITKYAVKSWMFLYESRSVIGDFFKLTYIENPGMAFGIQFENKILFTILSILAALIILVYLIRLPNERFIFKISLGLILGGAIGNLIDRIIYGRVVDFFDVEFFDISIPAFSFLFIDFPGYSLTRWPVFNIADSAVTCGMILITWMVFFQKTQTNVESVTQK
jgi:signal peptidase II